MPYPEVNQAQELVAGVTQKLLAELLSLGIPNKKVPYEQRRYIVTDVCGVSPTVNTFWSQPGSSRALNCRPLEPYQSQEVRIGNLIVKHWPVDHSILGAGAFGIKTSEGWIIYTGDLRLHGGRAADTRAFMEEAARLEPLALICEGTHPDTETPVGEEEVYAYAAEAVRKALGLVVATPAPGTSSGPSRQHCSS